MRAVFTICAKNYLAQARTLGDSIRATNPGLDFYIFLSDERSQPAAENQGKYLCIEVKNLGIPRFREMCFMYDVMELACAIKPFCFRYLFESCSYNKVIYLDPDTYVLHDLAGAFRLLDENFLVLTPHLTCLDLGRAGSFSEESFLYCGVYNLGFAAIRKSPEAKGLLGWWGQRLEDRGFADKLDALHVDQKWMDLVPSCYERGVCILKDPGYNAAHWNIHQRRLNTKNSIYYMDESPLVFFHFSSFDPLKPSIMTRHHKDYTLERWPEYRELFERYAEHLVKNGYHEMLSQPYAYSAFDDGVHILRFYRRLYRRAKAQWPQMGDPFATTKESFYQMLKKNGLLIHDTPARGEFGREDIGRPELALQAFLWGLKSLRWLLGMKRYHVLLRKMGVYSRPEEQIFLLGK